MNPAPSAQIVQEIDIISKAARASIPLFLTSAAAVWAGQHTGQSVPLTLAYTLFAYIISLLAVIDAKHGILPHLLTGTLTLLGLLLAPTLGLSYLNSALGAIIAFLGLLSCALLTERLTGKNALGGGDLWLILALGTWLGAGGLPMLLLAASGTGILSVLINRWLSQGLPTMHGNPGTFPLGPALCAAGWLALLYAPAYWQGIEYLVSPAR